MSEATPPSWPIHGVNLTVSQIRQCLRQIYAESTVLDFKELKKKSYNNRIYFIHLRHPADNLSPSQVVLKVIGRYFGPAKVQNEVACLLLLARYCPEIPAPRVLAWSEDGARISVIRNGTTSILNSETIDGHSDHNIERGWILLSRLPGEPLTKEQFSECQDNLVHQVAALLNSWRTNIPRRETIGNMIVKSAGYASASKLDGLETPVSGLLLCASQPEQPLRSTFDYYQHLLHDQTQKLKTNKVFEVVDPQILVRVEYFRLHVLPHLTFLHNATGVTERLEEAPRNAKSAVFTHQDFAPRNILVSESPDSGTLSVTGILDFEFAGFFPEVEEFVTCMSRQASDWDQAFTSSILPVLTGRDVAKHMQRSFPGSFELFCQLDRMIQNIAPWQLESGHVQGQELKTKLEAAKHVVLDALNVLEHQPRTDTREESSTGPSKA